MNCKMFSLIVFSVSACGGLLLAASSWQKTNPNEWSSDDVYQILNNSPWSKTVKTTVTNPRDPNDQMGSQAPPQNTNPNGGGAWGNSGQMPGVGRRGYGSGTYGSGGYGGNSGTYGGRNTTSNKESTSPGQGPTEVTIQWQSALPVQIAAAKKASEHADISTIKPLDYYVIGVIGLPIRALGGRAASVDSDQTLDPDEASNLENRLLGATELLRADREPLHPVKVELNQGADGRILLYFPKNDPILAKEKTVEFRLAVGRTEIRKKFNLKDMEIQGKLLL